MHQHLSQQIAPRPTTTATAITQTATPPTATLTTALQSVRVINAPLQQLEYVLAQAMAKAFADMGINTTNRNDEVTYLVQHMPGEVTRNLPGLKIDEIPIAINHGVLGQYGEFFGLNVATFMRFLIAHYQSPQRAEAVKTTLAISITATAAPDAEQIRQKRNSLVQTAFEHYKANGFYNDYGSLIFDSINTLGKIPFNPKKETQILELARQNLINRYSRVSIYPDERATIRQTLNKIMHNQAAGLILTEAKRIALFELFDYLIEMDIDVLEFIEQGGRITEGRGRRTDDGRRRLM